MYFTVDKNILRIGTREVVFPIEVTHTEIFGKVLVVITDYSKSDINENVWGLNEQGEIIWQIPKIDRIEFEGKEYLGIQDPYTGIHKVDELTARLFNWGGGYYEVDPLTGNFTRNIVEFRKGKRPW